MGLLGFFLASSLFCLLLASGLTRSRKRALRERIREAGDQQLQEFPSGLPSKYYPGPMLLNFSVRMGTGDSNMAQAADQPHLFAEFRGRGTDGMGTNSRQTYSYAYINYQIYNRSLYGTNLF